MSLIFNRNLTVSGVEITFMSRDSEPDEVYARVRIGAIDDAAEGSAEALLAGDLFWRENRGATASLDDKGDVWLTAKRPKRTLSSDADFEEWAEDLSATVNAWRIRLYEQA